MGKEIKESSKKTKSSVITNIIAGKITRRYRMASSLEKLTGINRKFVQKIKGSQNKEMKTNIKRQHDELKEGIIKFLERDDNCRTLPGKADTVGKGNEKVQKKVLTDYVKNLHIKFLSENPNVHISMATFYRARPRHLALANFVSRLSCLCQRHQNMALKLKSLKSLNIINTTNPDQFIRDTTIEQVRDLADKIPNAEIRYDQWKRVKVDDGKLKTKLVQEVLTVGVFKEMFLKDVADFKEHTERVTNQFREVKYLKENLPNGHVIVQMDFAENYTCRSFEEVQSAYWNANSTYFAVL